MPRILLIDDDEAFRRPLKRLLERTGHEVIELSNGQEAARIYKTQPADVVVTDLIMPEKEGVETIMELKHLHPGVKIIAMSGGGRLNADDILKVAQQLGAKRTLAKPFAFHDLTLAIKEVMGEP